MYPKKDLLHALPLEPPKPWNSNNSNGLSSTARDVFPEGVSARIPMFNNLNRGRVAIFIDGKSLFYAALQLGIEINYKKLLLLAW